MERHKSLIKLSHEHHHGLVLAGLIRKGSPVYKNLPNDLDGKFHYTIEFYKKELISHFRVEEDILFPFISGRNKEIDNLVYELKQEHSKVHSIISDLMDETNIEDKLDKLGLLLKNHIRKEERELFTLIQEKLTVEELDLLSTLEI